MLELPPLSLYIHIPWCVRKCPYCDFNSHEAEGPIPEEQYIDALCDDFDRDYELCGDRKIESIFIGGGTPSLFSAAAFNKLLQHIQDKDLLSAATEITLEANPGTVDSERFKAYRDLGINRLSIGIQSFDDRKLQQLGRIHSGDEAKRAIEYCKLAGFENFNLDIMHSLPDQSVEEALLDLMQAVSFEPAHISWYQLTIEPNTVFYARPPTLPQDFVLEEIESAGHQLLSDSNYLRYEVSAYAHGDQKSRHNLNYWQFGDYIGIGAGAHGKITNSEQQIITRLRKHKQPTSYLNNSVNRRAESKQIPVEERALEFLLNALRLREGFSLDMFEARTGVSFSTIGNKVEYLCSNELLQQRENRISSTDKGYRVLNSILEEFL